MTTRQQAQALQMRMREQGRPWEIGKAFDRSAPIGPLVPAEVAGDVHHADIWLQVNGQDKQRSSTAALIWSSVGVASTDAGMGCALAR